MNASRLFLERCQQLSHKLLSFEEIDLLDLSAILRQLLLDGTPLVHKVNAEHKIKLSFRVGEFRNKPDHATMIVLLEDGLDPETRPPGSPAKDVTLDGLLQHEVLYIRGNAHTVKDVIKLAANVSGGVHHSANVKDSQKLIDDFGKTFGIGGFPAGLRQLKAISRVTLRGLQPLIHAITTKS